MDQLDWHMARAALQWQAELGVSDAVGDVPIDRYEVPAQSPKLPTAAATQPGATEVAGAPAAAMTGGAIRLLWPKLLRLRRKICRR